MDSCRQALDRAVFHSLDHLEHLDTAPVAARVDLESMRRRLMKPLADEGMLPDRVIDELVADSEGGIIGCAGGRFYAWVVGGVLPAALAADWLTSAWDQNAGIYASSPAAAVVEEAAGVWLKDLLNIPSEASFAFVTGCQMAHVTCLAAARHRVLRDLGWDVEENGLCGAPPVRVISGSDRHGSVLRAIRLLGLGKGNIVELAVDEEGRLPAAELERELRSSPGSPAIILLQAGELSSGAYDNFAELIPVAKRFNAWVHVDGAFGLWAAASPRFRHLLQGSELADSWATDGHKWLNVPYDCGYAFVKDRSAHHASMSHRESYLIHDADARDEMDWNPEWSRRARGFPTYAALRQLGRSGVASLVERCCDLAHALVAGIGSLPGARVVREPLINQGLVDFPNMDTDRIVAGINASGEAFFGAATWRGRRCMRVSLCNWMTSAADVERVIAAVRRVIKISHAGTSGDPRENSESSLPSPSASR